MALSLRDSIVGAVGLLLVGCSATFPVVGAFDRHNEVFRGNVKTNTISGTGVIQVQGEVTKLQCTGDSHPTYTPPFSFGAGQRGQVRLRCDDGRRIVAEYRTTSLTTGFGEGQDEQGNRFYFTFGMTDDEAIAWVQNESRVAARRPDLPTYRPKETRREKGVSTGTGFFVSASGHLLTSYHVIEDAKEITVVTAGGARLVATVVRGDPANDVVLLKVDAQTRPLVVAVRSASKGDDVFTLGYPLVAIQGQDQKATFGRVNALSGVKGDIRLYQTDVPIQPGNSGGPQSIRRDKS